ncbi:hypothetical protein [Kribbella sp. NPDC006257]|uniref:hypothetical protein n=1 Tax=Kribbella sp. NPDC006257 TaxID=3156738 RepID=UPI0033B51372
MSHEDVIGFPSSIVLGLIGAAIEDVRYWMDENSFLNVEDPEYFVSNIDHGLVLSTSQGDLDIAWCVDNGLEYLKLSARVADSPAKNVAQLKSVSGMERWASLIGSRISRIGVSFAEAAVGSLPVLWAFRIETDRERDVTVALGEVEDGEYSYHPSGLVAIFDSSLSQSVQILGSPDPAWGRSVLG